MIVLASVMRPSSIIVERIGERDPLDRHGVLLDALAVVRHLA